MARKRMTLKRRTAEAAAKWAAKHAPYIEGYEPPDPTVWRGSELITYLTGMVLTVVVAFFLVIGVAVAIHN